MISYKNIYNNILDRPFLAALNIGLPRPLEDEAPQQLRHTISNQSLPTQGHHP